LHIDILKEQFDWIKRNCSPAGNLCYSGKQQFHDRMKLMESAIADLQHHGAVLRKEIKEEVRKEWKEKIEKL